MAQQRPLVRDLTVVRDTLIMQSVLAASDTVAVQDTLAAQDTLADSSELVAEDTLATPHTATQPDSAGVTAPVATTDTIPATIPLVSRLFHEPPARGILNDRPFLVYLFVNIDSSQIVGASINIKNDSSQVYHEYPLTGVFGRFGQRLPVEDLVGSYLEYYFLVELRDYGLLAYPQAADGHYAPFKIPLVIPTQEYFQKR